MKRVSVSFAVVLLAIACVSAQAEVVFQLNFDKAAGVYDPYTPAGPGDVIPGSTTISQAMPGWNWNTSIAVPGTEGIQGGNVMDCGAPSNPSGAGYRVITPINGYSAVNGIPYLVVSNWTAEFVIKPAEAVGTLMSCGGDTNWDMWLQLETDGTVKVRNMGIQDTLLVSTSTINVGAWNHVALTMDNVSHLASLYINGVAAGTAGLMSVWPEGYQIRNDFVIGSHSTQPNRSFYGEMDAVAISDTVLGPGSFDIDHFNQTLVPVMVPLALSGRVTVSDYVGDLSFIGLEIEFRPSGSTTPTYTGLVRLDADGDYEWSPGTSVSVNAGTYDVAFKTCSTLRKVEPVTVEPGWPGVVNVTLTNGDVDGNNYIGALDHSMLSGSSTKTADP